MPLIVNDELYHDGQPGMHWGVRRYQNKDGTLTEAGKKRYRKMQNKAIKQIDKYSKLEQKISKRGSEVADTRYRSASRKYGELADKTRKLKANAVKQYEEYGYRKAMAVLEKESIKKMTFDGLLKDQAAYAKASFVQGGVATAVKGTPEDQRRNRIVSVSDREKARKQARRDAERKYK